MKIGKIWLSFPPIKFASYSSVILNSICIVLGIAYISNPNYTILWDVFGVILLISIFENLLLIFIYSNKNNEKNKFRTKMNLLSYIYLIFIILAMVCMMLGNLLMSVTYSNQLIDNLGAYTLIYFFYFGVLTIGISYAVFGIKTYKNLTLVPQTQDFERRFSRRFLKIKNILKKVTIIISRTTFMIGIIFGIVSIFGSFEVVTTIIAIISGQFGIFFSIIFLANTILLLKLKHRNWKSKKFYRTTTIGILVSGLLLVPSFLTQQTINDIERNFSGTFGPN